MKVYKVLCKETGLFWYGGSFGYHNNFGKQWPTIEYLKYDINDLVWAELGYPDCSDKKKLLEWRKNFFDKYAIIEYNIVKDHHLKYEDLYK